MTLRRSLIGVAAVACGVAATIANGAIAANDPRNLETRDDDMGRPGALTGRDPVAPVRPQARPAAIGNPLWGIPLDLLRETRERPIFTPSRRPPMPAAIAPKIEPVKAVVAPPPEPDQPSLSLLGVVIGAAEGYAVFTNPTTHDIVRLKTGEGHDGWILQSVSGREAVLEKNHRTAVVALPLPAGDRK